MSTWEGQHRWGGLGRNTREARLRWYGYVRRKEGNIGRRILRMELPGKRKRGRPKRRFMDAVVVEVMEEVADDRNKINGDGNSTVATANRIRRRLYTCCPTSHHPVKFTPHILLPLTLYPFCYSDSAIDWSCTVFLTADVIPGVTGQESSPAREQWIFLIQGCNFNFPTYQTRLYCIIRNKSCEVMHNRMYY